MNSVIVKSEEKCRSIVTILCGYIILSLFDGLIDFGNGSLQRYYSYFVIAAYTIYIYRTSSLVRINKYSKITIYFAGIFYLSLIWSINKEATLYRNNAYILFVVLYIIFSSLEFSDREIKRVEHSFLIGTILLLLWLFTHLGEANFFRGRLLLAEDVDANGFAIRLTVPIFISLKLFIGSSNRIKKYIYIVALVVFTIVGLMTGSRGFLVAVVGALFVLVFNLPMKHKLKGLIGLLLIATIVFLLTMQFLPENIYDRLFARASYSNEGSSLPRTVIWKACFDCLINDVALFGYGSGCDIYRIKQYWGFGIQAHNTYITMLMEYGILGLPVFIKMIVYYYLDLKNKREFFTLCGLMGLLFGAFFLSAFAKRYLWVGLMYAISVINTTTIREE